MKDFFKGKRVLVAGSTGFIGTNLCEKLILLGADVRGTIYNHPPKHFNEAIEYLQCDLTQFDDCLGATSGMDYVFMAAANSSGAAVMNNSPLSHLTPNVVMNTYMLAASLENNITKFCFISSNTVYPQLDYPVKEEDASFEFFDKYYIVGWMKRFSEIMCNMYSTRIDNPLNTLVVRPGNLYGPFDKFTLRESKVIAALIRRAIEREEPFTVWGDGMDMKDFLYIDDFVEGLLMSFMSNNDLSTVNVASGSSVSLREVIDLVLHLSGFENPTVKFDITKPAMIPSRYIDISKVKRLTGWEPKTSLNEGINATINWYRSYYRTNNPEGVSIANL
jgi:GDP-L-fucose synthase